jgi:hypothetical protein
LRKIFARSRGAEYGTYWNIHRFQQQKRRVKRQARRGNYFFLPALRLSKETFYMICQCEQCGKRYRINENKAIKNQMFFECSSCKARIYIVKQNQNTKETESENLNHQDQADSNMDFTDSSINT